MLILQVILTSNAIQVHQKIEWVLAYSTYIFTVSYCACLTLSENVEQMSDWQTMSHMFRFAIWL